MMYCLNVSNVNKALPQGLRWLMGFNGETEQSRNGPVQVSRMPVMTIYDDPTHRVLFSPMRDANPYFHLIESLWMLAGRNTLKELTFFNKQMAAYSDDGGVTQPAAYGHRWRNYFGQDQLAAIVAELKANPGSRRCVLSMWNPGGERDNSVLVGVSDLTAAMNGSADVPCNTQCFFRVADGRLNMAVTCRSNDIYWGAYGANAVHFSVLLEYMAAKIGVKVGKLYQFSWNYHFYPSVAGDQKRVMALINDAEAHDYYSSKVIRPAALVHSPDKFDGEVQLFMSDVDAAVAGAAKSSIYTEPFLGMTALPMLRSWAAYKEKDYGTAEDYARRVRADDWREASVAWMERRAQRRREKEAGL